MTALPTHGHITGFEVRDNCLCIAGRKLTDIAEEAGRTPLYIYDSGLISQRIEELRKALPSEIKIHYAIKANPMPAVVQHIAKQVDGLDVASVGELEVALQTNAPRLEISFAGPGKSERELKAAIEAGIVLNVESPNELIKINRIASELDTKANVAIRVNPDFELKSSGMKMSGGPKPFGIDAECVPEIICRYLTERTEFHGFHIFAGSQNLSASSIVDAQQKSYELAKRLSRECGLHPRFVNIGGGFGIPYFAGDDKLDLNPITQNLKLLVDCVANDFQGSSLVIELGRYLVGEAGVYVCEVLDKKTSRGVTFLVTNGGLHHHLAASGNFGQIIRKDYPIVNASRVDGAERAPMQIVGPLCTPLDILGSKTELPIETEIGDLVAVLQSGAYGFTASPLGFLSHAPPAEVLV